MTVEYGVSGGMVHGSKHVRIRMHGTSDAVTHCMYTFIWASKNTGAKSSSRNLKV